VPEIPEAKALRYSEVGAMQSLPVGARASGSEGGSLPSQEKVGEEEGEVSTSSLSESEGLILQPHPVPAPASPPLGLPMQPQQQPSESRPLAASPPPPRLELPQSLPLSQWTHSLIVSFLGFPVLPLAACPKPPPLHAELLPFPATLPLPATTTAAWLAGHLELVRQACQGSSPSGANATGSTEASPLAVTPKQTSQLAALAYLFALGTEEDSILTNAI